MWLVTCELDAHSPAVLNHQVCDTAAKVDLDPQGCQVLPEGLQNLDQPVCAQVGLTSYQDVLHTCRDHLQTSETMCSRAGKRCMEACQGAHDPPFDIFCGEVAVTNLISMLPSVLVYSVIKVYMCKTVYDLQTLPA